MRMKLATGFAVAVAGLALAGGLWRSDDGAAWARPAAQTASVDIRDFTFSPGSLSVTVGTTVTWENKGPSLHNVTSTGGSGPLNSGNLSTAQKYSFTFTQPGTYNYLCTLHPTLMMGSVTVTGQASTPTTSPATPTTAPATPSATVGPPPPPITRNVQFITPVRIIDTRPSNPGQNIQTIGFDQNGAPIQPGQLQPNAVRRFSIAGRTFSTAGGGTYTVPSDINGVNLNVTIVGGPAEGFVTIFPGDVPDSQRPNVSTVNPVTPIAFNFWSMGIPTAGQANAGTLAAFSTNPLDLVVDLVAIYR